MEVIGCETEDGWVMMVGEAGTFFCVFELWMSSVFVKI